MQYDIFGGVDGTGEDDDAQYKADFANSHVNAYFKSWTTPYKWYNRGPTLLGSETGGQAMALATGIIRLHGQVKAKLSEGKTPRVFLSGYSRGGAAVTAACDLLSKAGVNVYCLMLFDAVDRTNTLNAPVIPKNVKHAFHALRHSSAESREIFGNCALIKAGDPPLEKRYFRCTHGAMGGTPWSEDSVGSDGTIVELDRTTQLGALVAGGLISAMSRGALSPATVHKEVNKLRDTKVTPAQDKLGAQAVKAWMDAHFKRVRDLDA